jgi:LacI family transcriptional regulator
VGIFATLDNVAADVLEACRHLEIKVPEEVCVLGVDNNESITQFTHPPLSSIALPGAKIGFEAARLLDRLMAGEPPPAQPLRLPPTGVVARQSTNLLAIADEDVLAAVRYIREHLQEQTAVADLLRVVSVNRRYLEFKFKKFLGRSPLQEIRRMRIERARQLLAETDLSMPAVAAKSGFANAERLANVFRQELGVTPTTYRRQFRLRE